MFKFPLTGWHIKYLSCRMDNNELQLHTYKNTSSLCICTAIFLFLLANASNNYDSDSTVSKYIENKAAGGTSFKFS